MEPQVVDKVVEKDGDNQSHDLLRNANKFSNTGWQQERFDIQHWLRKTPWHSLKDTEYGLRADVAPPNAALWDDPLLNQIYKLDIATFLTAEHLSVEGISKLVSQAPDEACQVFLATQAFDEARHYEVFCRRLADMGVTPEQRKELVDMVTTPAMRKFYDAIREQVDRNDFVSAILAHNIILEGMAYPLYRYEIKYWSRLDPGLSQLVQGAFADEVHHVSFGEEFIKAENRKGSESRNKIERLSREFHQMMTEVFESAIHHYIGLYQEAANTHMAIMGDVEIFPGHRMCDTSEEDQVRILMKEVEHEYQHRLLEVGISLN